MTKEAENLQLWLNSKGADLLVDGKKGPATRNAIIEVFRNRNAPAVKPAQIATLAEALDCLPVQIRAVARTEGAGAGWDKQGLLLALWERHYLWRRVRVAVPLLSNPKPGGYTVDADDDGINDSWEKLADAACRFTFNAAAECASFGKFQIMGAHWKALGYRSVADFIWQLSRDEFAHYQAFGRFILVNGLAPALRRVSAEPATNAAFAGGYNGKHYAKRGYHTKIASNYRLEAQA